VSNVIADTGPLVAFLVQADSHHIWTIEQLRDLLAPFFYLRVGAYRNIYLPCARNACRRAGTSGRTILVVSVVPSF
jgi:hypothetical protein